METDMFERCMAQQQGDEAGILIYGKMSTEDAAWLVQRLTEQDSLPEERMGWDGV